MLYTIRTYFTFLPQSCAVARDFISALPAVEHPAVFGLHNNAALAHQHGEARLLLATLAATQPRAAGLRGDGVSDAALILQVSHTVLWTQL